MVKKKAAKKSASNRGKTAVSKGRIIPEGRRFKPGQSGNPNGRPKKIPQLDKLLAEVLGEDEQGRIQALPILKAVALKARKGNVRAAEVLLNRAYGLPKQSMEISNPEGQVFKIGYGNEE